MANNEERYIPGICNIGRAEVRQRQLIGYISAIVTIALAVTLFVTRLAPAWRLLLFFPAAVAAVGFLQSAWHFCAKFGLDGVFNFGPEVGRTDPVAQAEFRRQDRRTALKIVGLSALAGALIAAAAYLAPF